MTASIYEKREDTYRARVVAQIAIAIIACIISVVSLAVTAYQYRYSRYGVKTSKELVCDYQKNGNMVASGSFKPSKGNLEFGFSQTQGTSRCRYTFAYKKNTSARYLVARKNFKCKKNNNYYGSYKICKANGTTAYNFKITKTAAKNKPSTLVVDLAIL